MFKINGGVFMKKGDILIFVIVIVIMAILGIGYYIYINSIGSERYVNIYVDGELYDSVKLVDDVDRLIVVDNEYGRNDIRIYNNGFQVIYADCKNQDDVRRGFVNMPGFAVICLPHHLKIVIEGNTSSEIDDVSS